MIRKLLGETFGGRLVSDYYSAYSAMNSGQQGQNVLSTIKKMLVAAWATGSPAVVAKE